jgi:hypothetical protein
MRPSTRNEQLGESSKIDASNLIIGKVTDKATATTAVMRTIVETMWSKIEKDLEATNKHMEAGSHYHQPLMAQAP